MLLLLLLVVVCIVATKTPLCVDVFGTSDPPTLSPIREREHALHRTDEEEEGGGAAATNDDDIDALIIIEIVSVVFLNGA